MREETEIRDTTQTQLRQLARRWGDADGGGLRTVVFSGRSGTGKTLAAEVLATQLGRTVERVDLSMIISKYIGETEKNLDRIFARDTLAGRVLFFDEADALFGARTEVQDTHDRFANVEVSYLLRRLREADVPAIFSTEDASRLPVALAEPSVLIAVA